VVPSYRRPNALKSCLHALVAQSLEPLEVIVVLRAEDQESRAVVARAGSPCRVVTVDRPGQVAALNKGCESARGEFIAITDDDAAPRPDWLRAIAARFAADARIGAVGGRDVVHHGDEIDGGEAALVGRVLWWGRRIGNHHLEARLQDVDFLKGANMAFRTAAWRPFDGRLWGEGAQVCNDLEATWAVRRRGWRVVYDPEVEVDHYPAPRHDSDGREGRSAQADRDQEHNETYALLRHAAWWHWPILFGYRVLVGSRQAPGLLLVARPGTPASERRRARGLTAARLSALRSLRGAPRF
jgi:cellulose synthase/poly-beta-1,6-N-acetylglucosamine synthase-like glycosyltransferase